MSTVHLELLSAPAFVIRDTISSGTTLREKTAAIRGQERQFHSYPDGNLCHFDCSPATIRSGDGYGKQQTY
jgi:hypothetical protein